MRYALCLLTSPRREETLARTLDSFQARVYPKPSELLAYYDGYGETLLPLMYDGAMHWNISTAQRQGGFCRATRNLWKHAYKCESPWIFWLEDDFVFTRNVNLEDLAYTMECEPQVAQMALYRQPVNDEEKAAGGFLKQHPEEYERKGGGAVAWFETRRNWTTNPALFRREVCQYNWPDGPFCEGKFGFRIRELQPETTFGIWGAGEPWVEHIGVREGTGY